MSKKEESKKLKKKLDELHEKSIPINEELEKLKKNPNRLSNTDLTKSYDDLCGDLAELDRDFRETKSKYNSAKGFPHDDYPMADIGVTDWDPEYWDEEE